MGETTLTASQLKQLRQLRNHWGGWYRIISDGETWTAERKDDTRDTLAATSARELTGLLQDHYAETAVRQHGEGGSL